MTELIIKFEKRIKIVDYDEIKNKYLKMYNKFNIENNNDKNVKSLVFWTLQFKDYYVSNFDIDDGIMHTQETYERAYIQYKFYETLTNIYKLPFVERYQILREVDNFLPIKNDWRRHHHKQVLRMLDNELFYTQREDELNFTLLKDGNLSPISS